jgi:hypothetical protein
MKTEAVFSMASPALGLKVIGFPNSLVKILCNE